MNAKFPVKLAMKDRRSVSSSSQQQTLQTLQNLRNPQFNNVGNMGQYENALFDEEQNEDPMSNGIDSPNLLATSVENNSLLSSNSTISLLSLNRSSISRTTSFSNNTHPGISTTISNTNNTPSVFTNPIMFQRVNLRRYSSTQQQQQGGNPSLHSTQPALSIDTLPETPNLDPVSIQNSPSNFWLNKPTLKRHSSVTNQMNVDSPFLYPVRDQDGNVTPLILSPKKE